VPNRINQLDGGAVSSGTGSAVEGIAPSKSVGSAAGGSNGSPGAAPDSVSITPSGRALAAVSQAVQEAPEVDNARVSTLQQAIASGSYSVDADRIAGRMLQLEQDLGGNAQ
jgi:negative regulator of flagellin synthesis FlgM